jgi:DNA-binding transcriptional regulator GbsR (MarR family)
MSTRNSRQHEDDIERHRTALMDALEELDRALEDNTHRAERMRQRIAELRAAGAAGQPIRDLVPEEEPPLIVQLLTESSDALDVHGSRVRRAEARTLYSEGLTMDEIAGLFGVSRQRVSALLRDA